MTTGLDDDVPDNHCTLDTCLKCLADPGKRWAYHNAPYTLLEKVIEKATGQNVNTFTAKKVKLKTGMTGLWQMVNYDNVFFSKPRSMARYGLLILNKGIWNKDTLLHDTAYFRQMVNTSQNINKSYGYLWWLNGKSSYMLPTLQTVFSGSYAPDAPSDMFSALGKNGQILSISPGKRLIFVRMGDRPGSSGVEVPTLFCNEIWQKINELNCSTGLNNTEPFSENKISVYPNPAASDVNVCFNRIIDKGELRIYNVFGQNVKTIIFNHQNEIRINRGNLPHGIYFISLYSDNKLSHSIKLGIVANAFK